MDELLGNRNLVGYVLLVALAALIILRLQMTRRRGEEETRRRRPAQARLAQLRRGAAEPEAEPPEMGRKLPGKPASFGQARLQFYVMILAALALVVGYLVHLAR